MPFKEIFPLLVPIIIIQLILLAYTLHHIFTHSEYKRGTRLIWVLIVIIGMSFIGPILYFIYGKEDS